MVIACADLQAVEPSALSFRSGDSPEITPSGHGQN